MPLIAQHQTGGWINSSTMVEFLNFNSSGKWKSNQFDKGFENDPFLLSGVVKKSTKSKNGCGLWLDFNFIPMDSKKFGFWNFDYTIRFTNEMGKWGIEVTFFFSKIRRSRYDSRLILMVNLSNSKIQTF